MTPEQERALQVARDLVRLGVPLFVAPPDPAKPTGFALPAKWQTAQPSESTVDAWRPGWALGMVTGVALDLVDVDNYAGGQEPDKLPLAYLEADTPSGGRHYFVAPLGVESLNGAYPGVDIKSGAPDGAGRGFAFLAPTERPSKVDGRVRPYCWRSGVPVGMVGPPRDETGALLRQRILDLRARASPEGAPRTVARSVAAREWSAAVERLTADVHQWNANGWGGAAHAGLLAASTHLARLSVEHAEGAYLAAFAAAGVEPDEADLAKLASALERAVPDRVVSDEAMALADRFWAGGAFEPPKAPTPADPLGRENAGPFRFLDEAEAALIPVPDPLIRGLLFVGTKARLFGESTRGKTWLALDWAACVANDRPWLDQFEIGRPGETLFVAAEGAPSFAPRMRTWGLAHGRKSLVKFWPEPVQVGGPEWDAFVQACEREGFVLVVGDTQAAMTVGRKEDSNDDAGEVQGAWTHLVRSTGSPCNVSVHHTGWAEQGRPRGASAMFAGMDTELRLAEGRRGLLLVTEKQRYAEKLRPVEFALVAEHDGLVVRPVGSDQAGFFGDDKDIRARALLERLLAYRDSGGHVKPTYRGVAEAFKEMGVQVDTKVSGYVSRLLKNQHGMQGVSTSVEGDEA